MSITIRNLVVCGLLAVLGAGSIQAAPIAAINYDNSLTSARGDGPYNVGNLFHVNASAYSLKVTELGVQDITSNGSTGGGLCCGAVEVGLWNATGTTLLASTSVSNADPLTGSYRYAPISPILLSANTNYLIGAYVGSGITFFGDAGSAAPYSGNGIISLVAAQFNNGGSFQSPTLSGGGPAGRWAPASFLATQVPEPSTFAIAGFGLVGVLVTAARRRRPV